MYAQTRHLPHVHTCTRTHTRASLISSARHYPARLSATHCSCRPTHGPFQRPSGVVASRQSRVGHQTKSDLASRPVVLHAKRQKSLPVGMYFDSFGQLGYAIGCLGPPNATTSTHAAPMELPRQGGKLGKPNELALQLLGANDV